MKERTVHYHIIVSGVVQGVGFRAATVRKALSVGVSGYVQNMQDGTVSIDVEGNENRVVEFISWCKQGPTEAHIDHVDVTQLPAQGYRGFLLR